MKNDTIKAYILDSLPNKIIFVDKNHIIQYMNQAAKEYYCEKKGIKN